MKTSQIAIEIMNKIKEIEDALYNVENLDTELEWDLNISLTRLRGAIFNHIVRYEYSDFYLHYKKRFTQKKFIDNPKKTLEYWEDLTTQDLIQK